MSTFPRGGSCVAVLALALAAGHAWGACPWADPGVDPYRGTPSAAINRMSDIPAPVRVELIEMQSKGLGVPVRVTRDAILGVDGTARFTDLRDMNFGDGSVCRGAVDRSMWPAGHVELATAYSAQDHVVLHFRRCKNFARATGPKVAPVARPAPEPGSLWLTLAAIVAAAFMQRRRRP